MYCLFVEDKKINVKEVGKGPFKNGIVVTLLITGQKRCDTALHCFLEYSRFLFGWNVPNFHLNLHFHVYFFRQKIPKIKIHLFGALSCSLTTHNYYLTKAIQISKTSKKKFTGRTKNVLCSKLLFILQNALVEFIDFFTKSLVPNVRYYRTF